MRIFLHLIGIAAVSYLFTACGVKGDPTPYVQVEKSNPSNPANPQEGQK